MKRMTHVFIFLAVLYGIIILFFYLFQTGLLFFPQPLSSHVELDEKSEEVIIQSLDGNVLHGWLCRVSDKGFQKLIIYFGGNTEEVSHMLSLASMFDGWAVLLIISSRPYTAKSLQNTGEVKKNLLRYPHLATMTFLAVISYGKK